MTESTEESDSEDSVANWEHQSMSEFDTYDEYLEEVVLDDPRFRMNQDSELTIQARLLKYILYLILLLVFLIVVYSVINALFEIISYIAKDGAEHFVLSYVVL